MNIQLKQRLVGAVVLVALAVIFIPMLLSGEGNLGGGIDGSNIPSEPDFRFPPVPTAPEAPPLAAAPAVPLGDDDEVESPAVTGKAVSDKSVPERKVADQSLTTPPTKPPEKVVEKVVEKVPAKPIPPPVAKVAPAKVKPVESKGVSGWVVQVGSFSARNNARALRDKLRKQKYASFVESIKGTSGRVYRVRVGPELSKAAADKLRQRLIKEVGLKGLVQAYP